MSYVVEYVDMRNREIMYISPKIPEIIPSLSLCVISVSNRYNEDILLSLDRVKKITVNGKPVYINTKKDERNGFIGKIKNLFNELFD